VGEAVQRGHRVSILTRGRREPGLFEDAFARVEHLTGDRAEPDGLAALGGRTWDVVVETSGYRVPWTEAAVRALRSSAGHYMYVSSTGVYWPYHATGIAEDGRVLLADERPAAQPSYGVMKALSERAVLDGFGAAATIIRPGYIVGPGDPTDRWTYWPVRIAGGGEILVPGRRTDPVQYIDVRDLAAWMLRLAEAQARAARSTPSARAGADDGGVRVRRRRDSDSAAVLDVDRGLRLVAPLPAARA
jgi:2'-hydroxyisoflavone reductase